MKRLLYVVAFLSTPAFAWFSSDQPASTVKTNVVAVSSTAVSALPATALAGRNEVRVQNPSNYDLCIGTHTVASVLKVAGYLVLHSSGTATVPFPSDLPVYGIICSDPLAAAAYSGAIRVTEFKR